MPCDKCPLRATCTQPCEAVESLLPDEQHGRIHGLHRKNAAQYAKYLAAEIQAARALSDYRSILRGRMQAVFDLTYTHAMPQEEIARHLGIGRRAVSHYLLRARRRISEHIFGRKR